MPRFVLSYARLDGQDLVGRFFRDLHENVVQRCGADPDYFDQMIEIGDQWPAVLSEALRSSRLLVALYSHNFFNSEHCAREVQVFNMRRGLAASAPSRPKALLPVLWLPKRYEIPEDLRDLQYTMADLPPEYEKYGIARLMQLDDLKPQYRRVLFALADLIFDASRETLPPMPSLDYRNVEPAWRIGEVPLTQRPPAFYAARFIYACADGRDWLAFHPPSQKPIGILAMEASAAEQFHYEWAPLDANLRQRIEEATRTKALVVLVVEPAAVRAFRKMLEDFDQVNFRNCSVLIPINDQNAALRPMLNQFLVELSEVFHFHSQFSETTPYFRLISGTEQQFSAGVRQVLTALRAGQTSKPRAIAIDSGSTPLPTF